MLSLIIPCYNEVDNLQNLIDKILPLYEQEKDLEVILVNNGSTDKTQEILEQLLPATPIKSVFVPINKGYGYGILAGLDKAKGDILSWTHADLQTDPLDVLKAYKIYIQSPQTNLLIKGKRRNRKFLESFFTFGMQCYVNYRLKTNLSDINAQPKLFSSEFFKSIREKAPYDFSLDLFVLYHASKKGKIYIIDVDFSERIAGEAKGGGSWSTRIKLIKRTLDYVDTFATNMLYSDQE
ncbi:MAG: glycosyltransferase family 2 protein [Brevinema sp.]